ncbi:DUF488 domain-containing protein [Amycolatopsis pigmentata]|uniref:DUF488 family protein n=1 Tax=Amycolatopsis pigmentata TaxID=450801 RepID=A0ABW5FWE0_9PSEU
MMVTDACGVLGVGYEGREVAEFVADLADRGVTRLVDVRLTPISRKRGFSKTALRQALAEVGIAYDHRRELGNPKENRPGFAGSESELRHAKAAFADLLTRDDASRTLDEIRDCLRYERVALLCFEADQRRCHRDVVLTEILRRFRLGASTL